MRQVLNKYKLFLWTIKIPILLYAYPYNVKYILKMQNILDIILFEAYAEIRRRGKPHHHLTLFYHSYQKRGGYL